MKLLYVFVEGKDDVTFVNEVLSGVFLNNSIMLIPVQYQKIRNHDVKKHVKTAKAKNMDYVLLSDLDSHTYPCITSRKESRINELDGEITPDDIVVVVEEIESWCLAGVDSGIDEFSKFEIPNNTENITKEDFDEILNKTEFSKYNLIHYLSTNFNYKLACKRNQSFKYFLNKYNIS